MKIEPNGRTAIVTGASGLETAKEQLRAAAPEAKVIDVRCDVCVLVNALLVGPIHAGSTERAWREHGAHQDFDAFVQGVVQRRQIPMGRIGQPEEFGRIATFLAYDMASCVTGAAIPVDGDCCPTS